MPENTAEKRHGYGISTFSKLSRAPSPPGNANHFLALIFIVYTASYTKPPRRDLFQSSHLRTPAFDKAFFCGIYNGFRGGLRRQTTFSSPHSWSGERLYKGASVPRSFRTGLRHDELVQNTSACSSCVRHGYQACSPQNAPTDRATVNHRLPS